MDKPILTLESPIENQIFKDKLIIEGSILDDDKISGINISIDGEEPIFHKTFNSFSKVIEGLESGSHILKIQPKDNWGTLGIEQIIPFKIDSYSPRIEINSAFVNNKESIFYPGVEVFTDKENKILGTIIAGNQITSVSYKVENKEYINIPWGKTESKSVSTYSIPVDSEFNYGVTNFTLKVVDINGNETTKTSLVHVKNYSKINNEWGFYYTKIPTNKIIPLTIENPFTIQFYGPEIKSITISPSSEVLTVSNIKDLITIKPNKEGLAKDIKLIVETDKGSFESDVFSYITDNNKPQILIEQPTEYSTQSKVLTLEGIITDLFLEKLEYRISPQTDYTPLKWNTLDNKYSFKTTIDIPETDKETLSIEVLATDRLGHKENFVRSFLINENKFIEPLTTEEINSNDGKSSDKPTLLVNLPISNSTYFLPPTLSGYSRDDDKVKEIIITENIEGGKSITKQIDGLFDIDLEEFGSGKKNLLIVSKDKNGIESKPLKVSYTYEKENVILFIKQIVEPTKTEVYKLGSLISNEKGVILEGEIKGDIKGELYYSFSNGDYKKTTLVENKFAIILPNSLNWGQNSIDLKFIDTYGRETVLNSFFYVVDKINNKNIVDKSGIYFNDIRLYNDYINISESKGLPGYFNGRNIKDIKFEPESESEKIPNFISLEYKKKQIFIKSIETGISNKLRVVVTTIDGDIFKSDYYKFISDNNNPELTVETENNIYIQDKILLKGHIRDDIKVSKVSYSVNGGLNWLDLPLEIPVEPVKIEKYTTTNILDKKAIPAKDIKEFIFSKEIDYTNRPDKGYSIWLKAEDSNGNITQEKITFIKDNTNPNLNLFLPGNDEVNGIISLIGKSTDNVELKEVSYSDNGIDFIKVGVGGVFKFDIDFGKYELFPETFVIRSEDMAGNYTDLYPKFNINQEKDKPVVQIQTPTDGETIRNDFIISGMAFDDDGVDTIFYSLDGSDFKSVAKEANNFSLNIPLESVDDNEHIITVKAIDILGVESNIITSSFWVSKEEPTSQLLLPTIESTVNNTIKLVGKSFDENGIDSVFISTDNGVSYQKAKGQEDWNYNFNTKNIKDGTYSIFVKSVDKLETVGFYSTLINIDNTSPELIINEPIDGDILSDKIVFSGRSMDNVGLKDVMYKIYTHTSAANEDIIVGEGALSNNGIFNIDIPLEGYSIGDYNIELIAYDNANNRSISTRNFTVTESENAGGLELLFPQPGSIHTSFLEVSGNIFGRKPLDFVECYIDNILFSEIKVDEFKFFNLKIDTLNMVEGEHFISLKGTLEDGQVYETPSYDFIVKNTGAWLNIINMKTGQNISGRPFLVGEAGYIQPEDIKDEDIIYPELVEVSLDNGQIFNKANGNSKWSFRVETWQYEDGLTPILVRVTYSNGEIKTSRIAVNIDRSNPNVSVIEDLENGRFNNTIKLSGIASDENGLTDISVILRDGNKSKYEVPGLFQGMFIDVETGFGKLYGAGLGFTFFDDNVKLQITLGETRTSSVDARIKGFYYGFKLIANIYTLELAGLLGPDFDPFSMSFGVGASFTNKTLAVSDQDAVMWYSAIVSQLEIIKMKFDNKYIGSVSIFIDFEATLISSETSGGFYPRVGVGSRVTLF